MIDSQLGVNGFLTPVPTTFTPSMRVTTLMLRQRLR